MLPLSFLKALAAFLAKSNNIPDIIDYPLILEFLKKINKGLMENQAEELRDLINDIYDGKTNTDHFKAKKEAVVKLYCAKSPMDRWVSQANETKTIGIIIDKAVDFLAAQAKSVPNYEVK